MIGSTQAIGVALAVGGVVALMMAATAEAQEVFALDPAVKMSPEGTIFSHIPLKDYTRGNPVWDGRRVSLAGAKAERLAFQVMVKAGAKALPAVDVKVSDLDGKGGGIPARRARTFRQWYVKVTRKSSSPHGNAGLGFYPDALIPAEAPKWGLPVDVAAGKVQGIWVDLVVPRSARAGRYAGTVTVTGGGRTLAELPLTLQVYDFAIPAERHLRWRIGYTGWSEVPRHYKIRAMSAEWLKMEEQLYKLCWEDCRFAPTTHYNSPRPKYTWKDGTFAWDWSGYDKRFGKYLDGTAFEDGQPVNIVSLPINVHKGYPTGGRSADMKRLDVPKLQAAVKEVAKHWKAKGWRLEDTFVYVADEPDANRYPVIQKACETIVKASGGKIRTSVAFYTHFGKEGAKLVDEFGGFVTMWDIAGDCMPPDAFKALQARQKKGDFIGYYQGSEPYQGSEALDGDGLSLTTWPWIAWMHGLDTLFLYNMTEWTYFRLDRKKTAWSGLKREIWENPLNQSWRTNSQGVLLYPGQYIGYRGVIPSIRMKQIRRGMQDYEYLWLLANRGRKADADAICRRIIRKALHEPGGGYRNGYWQRDPRQWAKARKEMAAAIQK